MLYGSNVLLPQMLQTLMGYSALNAGLVLSPAGFVTMLEMPAIGILLSRGFDARKLVAFGLATGSLRLGRCHVLPRDGRLRRRRPTLSSGLRALGRDARGFVYVNLE